jgi:hypothetical protein
MLENPTKREVAAVHLLRLAVKLPDPLAAEMVKSLRNFATDDELKAAAEYLTDTQGLVGYSVAWFDLLRDGGVGNALPTEFGYYLVAKPSYGAGPVVIEHIKTTRKNEEWVDCSDSHYLTDEQVRQLTPLTRLVPETEVVLSTKDAELSR